MARIKRCEGMLGNERFVSKALKRKVQEEKDKLAKYQQMLEQVKEQNRKNFIKIRSG